MCQGTVYRLAFAQFFGRNGLLPFRCAVPSDWDVIFLFAIGAQMDFPSVVYIHLLVLLLLLGQFSAATDPTQTARAVEIIKAALKKETRVSGWHKIPLRHLPFDSLRAVDLDRSKVCSECMAHMLRWNIEVLPPGYEIWQLFPRPYLGPHLPRDWSRKRIQERWAHQAAWVYGSAGQPENLIEAGQLAQRCTRIMGNYFDCKTKDFDPELCTIWDPDYRFDIDGRITIPAAAPANPPPSQPATPGKSDSGTDSGKANVNPLQLSEQKKSSLLATDKRVGDGGADETTTTKKKNNFFTSTTHQSTIDTEGGLDPLKRAADATHNAAGRVLGGIVHSVQRAGGTKSSAPHHVPPPPAGRILSPLPPAGAQALAGLSGL